MLTESQTGRVWAKMLEAEVRAMYFGELTATYAKRKQIITGLSFFLSSGAAATLAAQTARWVPLVLSIASAILMAYSIAVTLEKAVENMTKLHYLWSQIQDDYEQLWNHWYGEDAEDVLRDILKRSRDASETGAQAPYDEKRIEKWTNFVYKRYQPITA
jgi:hypothetical protein